VILDTITHELTVFLLQLEAPFFLDSTITLLSDSTLFFLSGGYSMDFVFLVAREIFGVSAVFFCLSFCENKSILV
jgi:hypothetical protein